jgi:hypothetical protein
MAAIAAAGFVKKDTQLKLQDGVDTNQRNFAFRIRMISRPRQTETQTETLTVHNLTTGGQRDVGNP